METKRGTRREKVNRPLAQLDNRELSGGQTVGGQRESGWGRNGASESWQEDTLHFRRHCGSIIAAAESQLLFLEVNAFFLFFFF